MHEFGPFRYDPVQRLLFRGREVVPLVPKAIDTLHVLLERRGQVVEKAELMRLVWPDCVVEEIGLARNISLLRKALGDGAELYIETIPKRGYRFTAAAALPTTQAPNRRELWVVIATVSAALAGLIYWQFYWPSRYLPWRAGTASLAVLPAEVLGAEPGLSSFAEGLSETLAGELTKLESVEVMSPGTIRRYRKLGIPTPIMTRVLGLSVVVDGSVQKLGRQVRVSVRMTDVHSGKLIWADGYDVSAEDPSAQVTVARAVVAQIGPKLAR